MKTSRQSIITYLKSRPHSTANEVSRATQLTPADVRHHIRNMITEDVISISGRRKSDGPGRPQQTYILNRQLREHNLDNLAGSCLSELLENTGEAETQDIVSNLAERLCGVSLPEGPISQRLRRTISRLNELHYHARWEAHRTAPKIILGHCPYALILPDHPELCKLDQQIISKLAGNPAQLVKKLAQDPVRGRYCVFQLTPET